MITNYILSRTKRLEISPEVTPGDHGFLMFNDAGTEVEVSEFLYSLTKMLKPNFVLETGTHIGVSACFIAQALKENNKGILATFEIIKQHYNNAKLLWNDCNVSNYISPKLISALDVNIGDQQIDLLFLDSEPQLRFEEFVKFWPNVRPGGFIIIHDLHPSMGHHGQTYHGMYDWPYGDFRPKLGLYMKSLDVQIISFPTPRGLTLFQKTSPDFNYTRYMKDELND